MTLDSDMITKDTFVSCSYWDVDFVDDGTNIRYQEGVAYMKAALNFQFFSVEKSYNQLNLHSVASNYTDSL